MRLTIGWALWFSLVMSSATFAYQAAHGQLWAVALERAYFQTTAILFVWLMLKIGDLMGEHFARKQP